MKKSTAIVNEAVMIMVSFRKLLIICLLIVAMIASGIPVDAFPSHSLETQAPKPMTMGKIEPIWNLSIGGNLRDEIEGITYDSTGIYVCGNYNATGKTTQFLAKYDYSGKQLWFREWYHPNRTYWTDIAYHDGFLYVLGNTEQGAPNDFNWILLRFSANGGGEIWRNRWGKLNYWDWGYKIIADDYVYCAGFSFGSGLCDMLIAKFNPGNLTHIDERHWGDHWVYDSAESMVKDENNLYVAGWTIQTGGTQAHIASFDTDLTLNWNKSWSATDRDYAMGLAYDDSNIYVTGQTNTSSGKDALLLAYKKDGTFLWENSWAGAGNQVGKTIAVSGSDIYVAGNTTAPGANHTEALLLKFNNTGSLIWNLTWGGMGNSSFNELVANNTFGLLLGGTETAYPGDPWSSGIILRTSMEGTAVPELAIIQIIALPMITLTILVMFSNRGGIYRKK